MDFSHLDKKYFIDPYRYNCPFCKRNHVSYKITNITKFDWTEDRKCFTYYVKCGFCENISLHLSFESIAQYVSPVGNLFQPDIDIDSKLFFSRPSSFFILDDRIPKQIRDVIFESEQARQANLLIGASACLRKAIYELLDYEKSIEINPATGRPDYSKSLKNLKSKFTAVSSELFDALGQIQELTSDIVNEGAWDSWDSKRLQFLIELLESILNEIYVIPEEKKNRLSMLNQLKTQVESKTESGKQKIRRLWKH